MKTQLTILFILIFLLPVPVTASENPGGLQGHRMVMVDENIFLFGGSNDTTYFNWDSYLQDDFFMYKDEWTKLKIGPKPRFDHSMTVVNDTIYLFGGAVLGGRANDLWKYKDGWTQILTGTIPPNRSSAGLVYDEHNHRLLIFGGKAHDQTQFNDIWGFYLDNNSWVELETKTHPSKRYGHSMVYDPTYNVAIVFGGNDYPSGKKSDLWIFDVVTDTWEELDIEGPAPRYWHLAAYNAVDHEMVIFGGDANVGYSKVMDDTWKFDYNEKTWTNITTSRPAARQLGAMVFDGENYIIYGGYHAPGELLDDMWVFQDSNWETTTEEDLVFNSYIFFTSMVVLVLLRHFRSKISRPIWR